MVQVSQNDNFFLNVSDFPAHLQDILKEVDDEGNGKLEMDELEEVFSMYASMKKAAKDGSISLKTLPKEIQPSLAVFDVDKDGSVAPLELARAAELYANSKKQVRQLIKAVIVLLVVLAVFLVGIGVMTSVLLEAAKETSTSDSGIVTVKGSDTPTGTGGVMKPMELRHSLTSEATELDNCKSLSFHTGASELSYTITGWSRDFDVAAANVDGLMPALNVKFFSARGDVVTVTREGVVILSDDGAVVHSENFAEEEARRRHLSTLPSCGTLAFDQREVGVNCATSSRRQSRLVNIHYLWLLENAELTERYCMKRYYETYYGAGCYHCPTDYSEKYLEDYFQRMEREACYPRMDPRWSININDIPYNDTPIQSNVG